MKRMLWLLLVLAIAVSAFALGKASPTSLAEAVSSGEILRLHVVANSDSSEDQALKFKVRDAVLAAARPLVADAGSAIEARAAVESHLAEIEEAARSEARAQGYGGTVRAGLGQFMFPERSYDGVRVPAGTYDALRVSLGTGKGANWWCVVYPSLCFEQDKNAAPGKAPTDVKFDSVIVNWVRKLLKSG